MPDEWVRQAHQRCLAQRGEWVQLAGPVPRPSDIMSRLRGGGIEVRMGEAGPFGVYIEGRIA